MTLKSYNYKSGNLQHILLLNMVILPESLILLRKILRLTVIQEYTIIR